MLSQADYNSKRDAFLDHYKVSHDMVGAAKALGLSALSAYKILKTSGAMAVNDRLKYGTDATKMGAHAEIEFKKFVPNAAAMNADDHIHPGYDFTVCGVTIDVKSASATVNARNSKPAWRIHLQRPSQDKKTADFYVIFLAHSGQKLSSGYDVYILPSELVPDNKQVSIAVSGAEKHWISDFKTEPSELAAFFNDITDGSGVVEGAYFGKPYQFKKMKHRFLSGRRDFFKVDLHNVTRMRQKIERMCAA